MEKSKLMIVFAIVLPLLSMTNVLVKLERKSIFDNMASIKVPTNFRELNKQEKIADYSSQERPVVVFTNKEKTVFITFDVNQSYQGVNQEKLSKVKEYYVELNNHFGNCIDSGMFENNGKKYGFVKVEGLTKKTKKVYVINFFLILMAIF